MTYQDIVILSLIQGITEFLPVSSSAHLEIWHKIAGETPDDLTLDVAVHLGTLFSAIAYFRKDVLVAIWGLKPMVRGQFSAPEATLTRLLIIATIPLAIVGAFIYLTPPVEGWLRQLWIIGAASIFFGIVLWIAVKRFGGTRTLAEWTTKDALLVGCFQALALIPGTSRSGITLTGALALGYTRTEAARIAMLMSIPAIILVTLPKLLEVVASGNWALGGTALLAMVLAFVFGYLALTLMMRFLQTSVFGFYLVWRVLLGFTLLAFAFG